MQISFSDIQTALAEHGGTFQLADDGTAAIRNTATDKYHDVLATEDSQQVPSIIAGNRKDTP